MKVKSTELETKSKNIRFPQYFFIGGRCTCHLLPALDTNTVKQTEICTQGPWHWTRQVLRSSKLINHWVYAQILVEMIQEDRTMPHEINISFTLGIRTASVEGISVHVTRAKNQL